MNKCPKCNEYNPNGAEFCQVCSQKLLCDQGHVILGNQQECLVCRAEPGPSPKTMPSVFNARVGKRHPTVITPSADARPLPSPYAPEPLADEQSIYAAPEDSFVSPPARKPTQFNTEVVTPGVVFLRNQPRLVAVLVTFTWHPAGQMFPIHEGRTRLGRDKTQCDISLPADGSLSDLHATFLYRGREFQIADEKSKNGTFVNGEEVPLTGMPLPNYAKIKTGATTWTFVQIELPANAGANAVSSVWEQ